MTNTTAQSSKSANQGEFPYPPDTRAKGWRFELDHERIHQSDTWALASPEIRPWLLMLWLTAWEQTPCGSLPADDTLITARIGMPLEIFTQHREILLRGWKEIDGRLFHPVITERVLEMLSQREKGARRVADYRARKGGDSDNVTRYHSAANAPVTRHQPVSTTPEPEPEPEPEPAPEPVRRKERAGEPRPTIDPLTIVVPGCDAASWARWIEYRRAIKRPYKPASVEAAQKLLASFGGDQAAVVEASIANGWQGLFPLRNAEKPKSNADIYERNRIAGERWVARMMAADAKPPLEGDYREQP